MQPVFEIETVQSEGERCWLVAGRSHEEIAIGEILSSSGIDSSAHRDSSLVVLSISTYGREVTILDRMLTGCLRIEGPKDEDLIGARFLFKSAKVLIDEE